MISQTSPKVQSNLFTTPPSNKLASPKSITRKPSFINFTKKKPTEIGQIRSSDRIRFISPNKANLFIAEDAINPQNSIEFNYTQYSSNQQINYPFIKKCASPKHFDQISLSRKSSFCDDSAKQDNSFMSTFLEPSIQDFCNCQFALSRNSNTSQLQQEISALKKTNFELNLLVDEKNQLIQKQKLENDTRLAELTQELVEIKNGIQKSEFKIIQNEKKMINYQTKVKQLEEKLSETTEKLEKAEKQVKMFKAKYKINFNNPKLTQDLKSKKYHQNCCKGQQNYVNHNKTIKQHEHMLKPTLKEPRKSCNLSSGPSLKKIKSQTILPGIDQISFESSPQASRLMKIHCIEEEFNEYISMKVHIENLSKEIRYKNIEILTLKKTKCEYEKEKENFEKVKKFNKKLLSRVEFLTQQISQLNKTHTKRLSLPLVTTPKKKFRAQYEDFEEESDEQQVSEFVEFELSPEKNYSQTNTLDRNLVFDIVEEIK